jgi:hypothetical protein
MQGVTEVQAAPRPRAAALDLPRALLRAHWPALLAAGITIVAGIPTLNYPYGPDQALFAHIGDRLRHGAALYVDVWDVKPPGVFLVYALIGLLPGPEFRVLRAVDLLCSATAVLAVYVLGYTYWNRLAGAVAGGLWGVTYVVATGFWHSAQPDSFMVLPLILALLVYELGRRRADRRLAFASGVLFAFCAQLRPVILLLPAVLVLADLSWSDEQQGGWRGPLRSPAAGRGAALILGGLLLTALILLWLALGGALGEYVYAQLDFASAYARSGGPYSPDGLTFSTYLSGLRSGTMFIVFARTLLVAPALVAVVAGAVIRRDRYVVLTAWLALAAYAGVAVQGKYFLYHWHALLPLLALLSGWTAAFLWQALRSAGRSAAFAGGTLAAIGCVLLALTPSVTDRAVREWEGFVQYFREPEDRGAYYDRFGLYGRGTFSYRASEEVATYLRAQTQPGDTIFIWGYDPLLFVQTGRDSPSRFLSFLPLMSLWTPPRWHNEFVDDLERARPAYIVVQRNENAPWITGHRIEPPEFIPLIPRFQSLLEREYEVDRRIEDYTLYRRRQ